MADSEFTYKGKKIVIRDDHPNAVVSVDGREFKCHHHHPPEGKGLTMWMCDEAYFATPDLTELAKHFADYGYMFDDPGRVVVNDAGEVVPKGTDTHGGTHGDTSSNPHNHDKKPGSKPAGGKSGQQKKGR